MPTWLITGSSTGLGRALAEAVIAAGHNTVVTARDVEKVADLVGDTPATDTGRPIEPGAFRTDFAGRSITQSSTVIDDYAATAGKRRKEHDTVHGTQPGDPTKAAKAIIAAVESDEPPAFLLLGNDVLNTYGRLAEAKLQSIKAWEHLTTSTDIDA